MEGRTAPSASGAPVSAAALGSSSPSSSRIYADQHHEPLGSAFKMAPIHDLASGLSSTRITLQPPAGDGEDDLSSEIIREDLDRSIDWHSNMDHSDDHSTAAYDISSATLGRHLPSPMTPEGSSLGVSLSPSFGPASGGKSLPVTSRSGPSLSPLVRASSSLEDDSAEVLSDAASSTYLTARRDPASVLSGPTAHPPSGASRPRASLESSDAASVAPSLASPRSTAAELAAEDRRPLAASSKTNKGHSHQGSASSGNTLRHSSSFPSQAAANGGPPRKSTAKRSAHPDSPFTQSPTKNSTAAGSTPSILNAGSAAGSLTGTHASQHSSRSAMRVTVPRLPSAPGIMPAPPPAMYWSKAPVHGTVPKRSFRAHTANLADEVMWLFGGCDAKGCFRDLWCFDTETMCWSKPKVSGDLPPPRRAHSATMIDRMLFVFGGGDGPHYFNDLYIFDAVSLRWTKPVVYGTPPSPRRAHTANAHEGHMIVFGGGNGVGALNDVYSMDCSDLSRLAWKKWDCKGKIPIGRGYHTSNVVDGKLIVIGGSDGHMSFNDIHVLKLDTKVWYQVKTDEIHNRLGHTATQVGSYLFVVGGHDSHSYTSEILTLNLVNLQWEVRRVCGKKPPGRGYHQAWLRDSRLFVHGGFDGKEIYDDLYFIDLAAGAYLPQITSFSVELEEE